MSFLCLIFSSFDCISIGVTRTTALRMTGRLFARSTSTYGDTVGRLHLANRQIRTKSPKTGMMIIYDNDVVNSRDASWEVDVEWHVFDDFNPSNKNRDLGGSCWVDMQKRCILITTILCNNWLTSCAFKVRMFLAKPFHFSSLSVWLQQCHPLATGLISWKSCSWGPKQSADFQR